MGGRVLCGLLVRADPTLQAVDVAFGGLQLHAAGQHDAADLLQRSLERPEIFHVLPDFILQVRIQGLAAGGVSDFRSEVREAQRDSCQIVLGHRSRSIRKTFRSSQEFAQLLICRKKAGVHWIVHQALH